MHTFSEETQFFWQRMDRCYTNTNKHWEAIQIVAVVFMCDLMSFQHRLSPFVWRFYTSARLGLILFQTMMIEMKFDPVIFQSVMKLCIFNGPLGWPPLVGFAGSRSMLAHGQPTRTPAARSSLVSCIRCWWTSGTSWTTAELLLRIFNLSRLVDWNGPESLVSF